MPTFANERRMAMGKYINPYTDFGFKLLFGTEDNKEVLITFLNALLKLDSPVKDIKYLNGEMLGTAMVDRRAIFDVYCTSEDGSYFIVEMQKAEQNYFIDRTVYYASFPIQKQAPKTKYWDFRLTPVYAIGILDFNFDDKNPGQYLHEAKLTDQHSHDVLYDKLTFVYIEMRKFRKEISECETLLDKMLFVLKNMVRLFDRPSELQERVFERMFRAAEMARFTPEQQMDYEESLKIYRDLNNVTDTAYGKGEAHGFKKGHAEGLEEGRAEGLVEGRAEGRTEERYAIAANMKSLGMPVNIIRQATGLTEDEVQKL